MPCPQWLLQPIHQWLMRLTYCMHIDFALPSDGSLAAGFKTYQARASKSCMDYGFHMIVTSWNDNVASDMEMLVKDQGKAASAFLKFFSTLRVACFWQYKHKFS